MAPVGVSVSRTCTGSYSHTSSPGRVSFAPRLIKMFGPQEFLLVTLPGTAKTSLAGSLQSGQRGLKDVAHAAEMLDHSAASRGA
jgi:hypothetical protein